MAGSSSARLAVACLLQELKQKDETIKELQLKLVRVAASPVPATPILSQPAPPTLRSSPRWNQREEPHEEEEEEKEEQEIGHMIVELKSCVARLEYENAKLKIDLQNRWGSPFYL